MRIAFHTLGCKVNQYETEAMAEIFRDHGHEIVGEEDFADVYVVNTCTVTAMADRKSRQFIRRMKKKNPDSIIAVTGCYVQIDPEAVESIEGVDIITGINEKGSLPGYVEEIVNKQDITQLEKHVLDYDDLGTYEDLGTVTTAEGRTRAYIKVEDGCNRFCSYCVIPYARGAVRSRPLDEIVDEAKKLIEAGYREIVLTGINTALYGADGTKATKTGTTTATSKPENPYGIETVIAAIEELGGDFRIRLSSLEPTVVDADYVKRLLKYDKLCHHMHLSAQSGSDDVLEAMNRSYTKADYEEIVKVLREHDPCYGISTDIIVGFPGETDEDVAGSIDLIEECRFCRTHVFRYSPRPKTKAAQMDDQVPPEEKARRGDMVQEAGDRAAADFFERSIGDVRRVLIEERVDMNDVGAEARVEGEAYLCGYTDNYIRVYIRIDEDKSDRYINTFVDVGLVDHFRDGMLGELLLYEK